MKDFIQSQIEASERLYKMMLDDHKERTIDMAMWADTNFSLIRKLDERDEEIKKLREEISILKAGK